MASAAPRGPLVLRWQPVPESGWQWFHGRLLKLLLGDQHRGFLPRHAPDGTVVSTAGEPGACTLAAAHTCTHPHAHTLTN
jgi:hypothetical protein